MKAVAKVKESNEKVCYGRAKLTECEERHTISLHLQCRDQKTQMTEVMLTVRRPYTP